MNSVAVLLLKSVTKNRLIFSLVIILLTLSVTPSFAEGPSPLPPSPPKLTLNDCVLLALMNNLEVKGAYLDRILNRWDLQKAERAYWFPDSTALTLSSNVNSKYNGPDRTQGQTYTGSLSNATLQIPTGGKFTVTWDNPVNKLDTGRDYTYDSKWTATFTQPLLKSAGLDNTSFAVKKARLDEEKNLLNLRSTISGTIGTAITKFRAYRSSIQTRENSKKALENARRTYETNKALIDSGRMARTEIVQSEADIANRELDVVTARNGVDAARLDLLSFLNIDKNLNFDPVDESEIKVTPPSLAEAVENALKNRTDYVTAVYNQRINKWAMENAKWNQLWQLDLNAATNPGDTGKGDTFASAFASQSNSKRDWSVGLTLTIPITDMPDAKKDYISAKNTYEKGEWSLRKLRTDIEIALQNAIRNVEVQYRSLELARQARRLSEQKLEIEQEKLKAGRTTNFQLVSFQNDLINQQAAEVRAIVSYLGSINALDDQLGITPERWGISIKKEDDAIRIPETEKASAEEKLSEMNRTSGASERKGP